MTELLAPVTPIVESGVSYRTVCVRLCDGSYFPLSFATTADHFDEDEQLCKSRCGTPAKLYVYKNPGRRSGQHGGPLRQTLSGTARVLPVPRPVRCKVFVHIATLGTRGSGSPPALCPREPRDQQYGCRTRANPDEACGIAACSGATGRKATCLCGRDARRDQRRHDGRISFKWPAAYRGRKARSHSARRSGIGACASDGRCAGHPAEQYRKHRWSRLLARCVSNQSATISEASEAGRPERGARASAYCLQRRRQSQILQGREIRLADGRRRDHGQLIARTLTGAPRRDIFLSAFRKNFPSRCQCAFAGGICRLGFCESHLR